VGNLHIHFEFYETLLFQLSTEDGQRGRISDVQIDAGKLFHAREMATGGLIPQQTVGVQTSNISLCLSLVVSIQRDTRQQRIAFSNANSENVSYVHVLSC